MLEDAVKFGPSRLSRAPSRGGRRPIECKHGLASDWPAVVALSTHWSSVLRLRCFPGHSTDHPKVWLKLPHIVQPPAAVRALSAISLSLGPSLGFKSEQGSDTKARKLHEGKFSQRAKIGARPPI